MPGVCPIPSLFLDINAEPHPPPCTKCGSVMVLARIKQASPGFDLRTFECLECHNADQYVIQYGTTAPWSLVVRD